MKLLLYCTKAKPYLTRNDLPNERGEFYKHWQLGGELDRKHLYGDTPILNGKIVAECDFEVEEIKLLEDSNATMITNTLSEEELLKKSCLEGYELCNYLYDNLWCGQKGYAIHIKNLHIFDKPKELSYCFTEKLYKIIDKIFTDEIMTDGKWYRPVNKAPQNMMRVKRVLQEDGILISIRPQWLCKILNGEKTIEVRKKVLKEML